MRGDTLEKAFYKSEVFGIQEEKVALLSRICAFMLALCQILQHYIGPLYNAAISILVIIVPFLMILISGNIRNIKISMTYPVVLLIFCHIYRVINHGTSVTEFGQSGVFIIYLIAMSLGCIDLENFVKYSSYIALFSTAGLILQYICYYVFGFHLQMVPTFLLLDSAEQWVLGAETGLAGITGVIRETYRPSAFFLEPSHVFLYTFPHLILFLFSGKDKKHSIYPALFLSLGMILSTSGMGVLAMCGSWVLYFIIKGEDGQFSIRNIFRPKVLVIFAVALAILIIAVLFVPVVHGTIMRIFVPDEEGGSTAIEGRVKMALRLLDGLSLKDLMWGVRDNTHGIEFNIPGFADILYRHGFLGLILSYSVYIWALCKAKMPYQIVSLVILVTSLFSAHTHSTVGMLYYTMILINGRKWR